MSFALAVHTKVLESNDTDLSPDSVTNTVRGLAAARSNPGIGAMDRRFPCIQLRCIAATDCGFDDPSAMFSGKSAEVSAIRLGVLVVDGDVVLDGVNELANAAKLPIAQPV